MIVRTAAEGASEEDIERDLVFLQRLWKSIEARAKKAKAPDARLPGGRAAAARRRATSSPSDFERALRRRRPDVQAHRRLPEEDVAAHGRAGRAATRSKKPLIEEFGVDAGDQVDARAAASICPRAATSSSTTPRRSPSSTSTPAASSARASKTSGAPARGHDHEEQPRGGQGGRPPAAAARHRRDHRHRLHRHGEPEEPGHRRGGAAQRARARPDEDVRRRDLAARARRDDAPERHRRAARDPDAQVPDLRRRRDRRLRGTRPRSTSSGGCARSSRARGRRRSGSS